MKLSVIGCGYAASMASSVTTVVGIDVDLAKVEPLSRRARRRSTSPASRTCWRDAGLGPAAFSTDFADAAGSQVHFVCVGTPQKRGEYAADLRYVEAPSSRCSTSCEPATSSSASRPCRWARRPGWPSWWARRSPGAMLAWNPEFLREGFAVQDTLHPDRLVYGLPVRAGRRDGARALLDEVYAPIVAPGTPKVVTDYATAEMVKTAANSFLATKISFINAMAELCEATGADVKQLADAIGYDDRIGRKFLNAGLGFGGGCLPKDIRAFMARAGELGADQALTFLREVDNINMRRRIRMVELAREVCDGSLLGKRVAVLGAAFKPDSDDIRDSPALNVAAQLQLQGAVVRVTDPAAVENSRGCGRSWTTRPRRRRPPSAPTPSCCSPSGSSTASSTRSRSARSSSRSGCSTGATCTPVTTVVVTDDPAYSAAGSAADGTWPALLAANPGRGGLEPHRPLLGIQVHPDSPSNPPSPTWWSSASSPPRRWSSSRPRSARPTPEPSATVRPRRSSRWRRLRMR